ncbi:MAG: NADH-quinone oxidoreductase subunit NuoE [Firmicutes bacterium]|nr:NADH-quinone oxidoreductase subunit NuoE [Bacillota bacterium]
MPLVEGEEELIRTSVAAALRNFERARESLIPLLLEVQEKLGYLPALAMELIAAALAVPAVDVYGLATFYNQFRLHPPGKHQIRVCMGTACYMVGGDIALDCFERRLGIGENETTPDREFSLERVACVGCCTMAPVVVIDEEVEGRVTPTRVDGILIASGKEIHPSTGTDKGAADQEEKRGDAHD